MVLMCLQDGSLKGGFGQHLGSSGARSKLLFSTYKFFRMSEMNFLT